MRVAMVTCQELPEPDTDEALYAPALREFGIDAELAAWDSERVKWARYDLCVLRSPWNYYTQVGEFLAWVERVAATTRLLNPAPVIAWNVHKSYLLELERQGIPITPTVLVRRGETTSLQDIVRERGFGTVVVKPAVSAGSYRTEKVGTLPQERAAGEAHLRALVAERDALVQPYLRAVEGTGERAVVCIDGRPTHAVRKSPRFGADAERVSQATPVSPAESEFARKVLACVDTPEPLLYARVDLVRDDEGALRLMELEVVEPSLFLQQHPPALRRFAAAVAARLK